MGRTLEIPDWGMHFSSDGRHSTRVGHEPFVILTFSDGKKSEPFKYNDMQRINKTPSATAIIQRRIDDTKHKLVELEEPSENTDMSR